MMPLNPSRRSFLQAAATITGAGLTGGVGWAADNSGARRSPNEEVVFGFVGAGIRFHPLVEESCKFGPVGAVADVDAVQRGRGVEAARRQHYAHGYPISIYDYDDYRRVLDRPDIDAVVIATPDHWHTKIAIEALQAGKDVYCEKPMTLTIEEGILIREAFQKCPRVFQVGTQQRTEFDGRFVTAAAMARDNRIGAIRRVTCGIDGSLTCDALPVAAPPSCLDWEKWLGQAPMTPYRTSGKIVQTEGYGAGHPFSRTHNYFRWWYEYSGGKLTDWGAHHVDIATWALDKQHADIGPYRVEPIQVVHPVPLDESGMPTVDDRFNTATKFMVKVTFDDGVELDVCDSAPHLGFGNGIMFEGEQGRYFVNRGKLVGGPVEDLTSNPLPEDAAEKLYGRKAERTHMGDFVDCLRTRQTPVSDAESHHRMLTICHAINIAMRLGRTLTFDPKSEAFVGDEQANGFVARERRKGYEITVGG